MERHAAFPDGRYVQGIHEKVPRLVEQDVAQPPPQEHADRHIDEKIVNPLRLERRLVAGPQLALIQQPLDIKPAEQQTGNIGEAVPFDRKRTELERNGIDDRIGNGEQAHVLTSELRAQPRRLDQVGSDPHSTGTG